MYIYTHTYIIESFKRSFDVDLFFLVFIEFVTVLLLFLCFVFFGLKACGILFPQPGIKLVPLVLEGTGNLKHWKVFP